jgi:N-acetylglutamate synthase-like GNAT family acetyltransferase
LALHLRKARSEDKAKAVEVELAAIPGMGYLTYVYDDWLKETVGDLSVVEYEGEIIGVGKYSRLPDGSVWLETLRVTPPKQGIGGGKILYDHWVKRAAEQNVKYMAMYTGITNVKSKGLAERYGLRVRGTYAEGQMPLKEVQAAKNTPAFRVVGDAERAAALVESMSSKWKGFMSLNRTWYRINKGNCGWLGEEGMVYEDPATGSFIVLGARMMPWQALNIPVMSGDYESCLRFAVKLGQERKVERLNIIYPLDASDIQEAITRFGFKVTSSSLITMGIDL